MLILTNLDQIRSRALPITRGLALFLASQPTSYTGRIQSNKNRPRRTRRGWRLCDTDFRQWPIPPLTSRQTELPHHRMCNYWISPPLRLSWLDGDGATRCQGSWCVLLQIDNSRISHFERRNVISRLGGRLHSAGGEPGVLQGTRYFLKGNAGLLPYISR